MHYYKPELSSRFKIGKESPDSIGQPTGEEPGVSFEATDSATENNRPDCYRDKGENVR